MSAPVDFAEARAKRRRSPQDESATEDDVALAFTRKYAATLRYDHDAGRWYEWDGARWRPDRSRRVLAYVRELARDLGGTGKASFVDGAERMARSAAAHAVNSEIWDADPMLLGTPAGTVDLRSGLLREARPDEHITRMTSCSPEQGEPTRWIQFLNEALAGDRDTIRFIRLYLGYCLTGLTTEHAMLFALGIAGAGKTVLLNTQSAILSDYAVTAAMETFTASNFDRHSTELAMLKGARLVTASETEEGRSWAEAKIKQITGGDPITARFMRQDHFTFRPQFKLIIVGNHAPRLVNPDDAMRRRFNIVEFNNKPTKPDLYLERKLAAEHGRILTWAIAGCREWQASGLIRPAAVADATSDYFASEDLFGQWIEERCNKRPGAFEMPATMYASWKTYALANGEDPGSGNSFGKKMAKRGYATSASNGVRAHRGIELRQASNA